MTPAEKLFRMRVRVEFSAQFLERESVVEEILCALLSGQHVLLELREYAARDWGDDEVAERAQVEVLAKLSELARRIEAIGHEARGKGRRMERVAAASDEVRAMVQELLEEEPDEEPRH